MENLYYDTTNSPVGQILFGMTERGLLFIHYPLKSSPEKYMDSRGLSNAFRVMRSRRKTLLVKNQLNEYFSGTLRRFRLSLDLRGTSFQIRVWRELLEIPFGRVKTYGEVARNIGRPKASRAVGMANHDNRLGIVVPCHRVIGTNGGLTGYAAGLSVKKQLLEHEKRMVAGNV